MNICYCFDRNYYQLVLKSAESVKRYNENAKFYFFSNDMLGWQYLHLSNFGKVIEYDENDLSEFGHELLGYTHISKACFVRFLIPKYLSDEQRALYLDCDTVCQGALDEYYNTDFENNYIVGCEGIDVSKRQAKELNIDFYINSGVLLFNIQKMNNENYLEQIKTKWRGCLGLPKVFSADETIINYVFHEKIKLISEKYNYCYNRSYKGREINPQDVVIWHVTGADKRNIEKCLTMKQP